MVDFVEQICYKCSVSKGQIEKRKVGLVLLKYVFTEIFISFVASNLIFLKILFLTSCRCTTVKTKLKNKKMKEKSIRRFKRNDSQLTSSSKWAIRNMVVAFL